MSRRVVVGVGARAHVPPAELDRVVADAVAAAGPATEVVLATVDRRGAVLRELGGRRGWPVVCFPAGRLAAVDVPHPSEVVRAAAGTASVAEAAALLAAGPGAELIVTKRTAGGVTVAVAQSHSCTGTLACICGR